MRKRRDKVTVLGELSTLEKHRDSDSYKAIMELIHNKLSENLQLLLSGELVASEIIETALKARGIYDILRMVPGEIDSMTEELNRIERMESVQNSQRSYENASIR